MNLAEAVAESLQAWGVRHAFGILAAGNLRLVHHLVADHGVAFYNARHEAGALGAADGYARVTGEVGICIVTQGPGFTNALTPLVAAARAHTPLVLISGDASQADPREITFEPVQAVDQAGLAEALGLRSWRVTPERAGQDVLDALATAARLSTPVVVNMPVELERSESARYSEVPDRRAPRDPISETEVRAIADGLDRSDRPLILAGIGAERAGAREPLERLAEHVGAALGTTLRAKGMFAGNPRYLGTVGGFSTPDAHEVIAAADCVVAFGAGLNQFTTLRWTFFQNARTVLLVDSDPAVQGTDRADFTAIGDAALAAEAVLAELGRRDSARVTRWNRRREWRGFDREPVSSDTSQDGSLDPRTVCAVLDEALPADRAVFADGGQFALFVATHLSVQSAGAMNYMLDFGATGGGLGPAIGAAIGRPDRVTVLFIGDGGLLMTLGDLDLAVRERVPLLIVCMNDGAYGSEIRVLEEEGLPTHYAYFDTPGLAEIAEAMGAEAVRVERIDELEALRARLAGLEGPLFIECPINPDVVSRVLELTQ